MSSDVRSEVTSSRAHTFAKPLLGAPLKDGDEWYAVNIKWFKQFEHFAYLDGAYKDKDDDEISHLEERSKPPPLNDSDLQRPGSNPFALRKDIQHQRDFEWIPTLLYQQLKEWFGIEDGTISFERTVINLAENNILEELIIEMLSPHTIRSVFVFCVFPSEFLH